MEVEETQFASGTLMDLVAAIEGNDGGLDAEGHSIVTNLSPKGWGASRTFGGLVVAQALHAAMRTVPDGLGVHSLHGYFLAPSVPGSTAVQRVERVRDGRSFSAREVTTEVEGRVTFKMMCSFHIEEAGDEYQLPLATDLPKPTDIEGFDGPFPFEIREIGPTERREDGSFASTRRCWFRTKGVLPDEPALHAALLSYMSDMTGDSFRPLSLGSWGTHTDASLDHALWFHRPRRADVWNYLDQHTVVNAGGRSMMRSTMYGDDGVLYMSMAQELLIRELAVPITFEASPWTEAVKRRHEEGKHHGTA